MENMFIRLLSRPEYNGITRYGVSALLVAVTAMLRFSLEEPLRNFPLLLFIPTVFLCALILGKGAGSFATILSAAVAAYFFIEPFFSFAIGLQNTLALCIFVAIGFAISTITDTLRRAVVQLNDSENAKALLLEELAHRTKNDLAIISSAITLQMNASDNPEVRSALKAANARVLVVAQAQERLRGDKDRGLVDLARYVEALCFGLGDLLRDVRPIAVRVNCEPLGVPSSVAIHVGLIVNELVTNSLKYAYPGEKGGIISVDITTNGSEVTVTVTDDGVGCPADVRPGLGSKLVRLLAKQLGGSVEREPVDVGCRVRVKLAEGHILRHKAE